MLFRSEEEAEAIKEKAVGRIEAAVEFGLNGEVASLDDLMTHVYAD